MELNEIHHGKQFIFELLANSNNTGGDGTSDGVIALDADFLLAFLHLLAYTCPYDQEAYISVDRSQSRIQELSNTDQEVAMLDY